MFLSKFMLNTLLILFLFRFLFLCCKSKKLQNFIDNFSHASHVRIFFFNSARLQNEKLVQVAVVFTDPQDVQPLHLQHLSGLQTLQTLALAFLSFPSL